MRGIADDMRLRMGLRLAVEDERPLPYAASEAVRAGIARDKPQASRVIRQLVEAGVIVHAGELAPRGKGNGTRLYAPPPAADDDGEEGDW
jgi:hypothetical protein